MPLFHRNWIFAIQISPIKPLCPPPKFKCLPPPLHYIVLSELLATVFKTVKFSMILCHTILKFLLASGGASYTSDVLTRMCIHLHIHGFFLEKIKWEQIKISKIERSQAFN